MAYIRVIMAFALTLAMAVTPAFASRIHRAPTSGHAHGSHKAKAAKSHAARGQQAIESSRAAEIQQALIREHYMDGDPSGKWDAGTVAAMQKYQADQGWQTKLMPDSRALKKLGLGPDYSGAINAKNSTFVDPPPVSTIPPVQSTGFASAAGVNSVSRFFFDCKNGRPQAAILI